MKVTIKAEREREREREKRTHTLMDAQKLRLTYKYTNKKVRKFGYL